MVKKAQGALEFLMTYGWAFLVILIMIGALAYFGVLNPSRFLPDRCDFGTQVLCKENQFIIQNGNLAVGGDNTIIASLTNNVGANIQVYNWSASTDALGGLTCSDICFDDDSDNDCTVADTDLEGIASPGESWRAGQGKILIMNCGGAEILSPGDKIKFIINYKWYASSAGSTFSRDGSGEIYASVQ